MDALNLHIEQRIWVQEQAQTIVDEARERDFVGALDNSEALLQRGVICIVSELTHRGLIIEHRSPADFTQEPAQAGICLHEPAAEGDTIRLVYDAIWIKVMQL